MLIERRTRLQNVATVVNGLLNTLNLGALGLNIPALNALAAAVATLNNFASSLTVPFIEQVCECASRPCRCAPLWPSFVEGPMLAVRHASSSSCNGPQRLPR